MLDNNKCQLCINWRQSKFKSLNVNQLDVISKKKKTVTVKKGQTIFEEGEILSGVYCIHSGVCKLSKLSVNGKNQIVRFVMKGEILGLHSVIGQRAVNLSGTALTDVQACFIPKEQMLSSFFDNSLFSNEIIKDVCEELKKADDTIVNFAQKTVKQRLADSLLFLENTFGKDPKLGHINIQLSREEIGNMIGTATESLIRMLSEFSKNGWIETKGKRITIIDRKQLQKMAQGI